ncbi:MAG: flagellar basal body rod protein FlgB [Sandaracinaceae bacterium]
MPSRVGVARPVLDSDAVRALFGTVTVTQRALDYHLERHNVLTSNVANVDTPGFRPAELVREDVDVDRADMRMRLSATDPGHVGASGEGRPFRLEPAEERVINPGNDGNAVSLEREMSKVAANQLRYEGAIRIVRHQLGLLRYASNDGHT